MLLKIWDMLIKYLQQPMEASLTTGLLPPTLISAASVAIISLIIGYVSWTREVKASPTGEVVLVWNKKPFVWVTVAIIGFLVAIFASLMIHLLVMLATDPVKILSPLFK